MQYQLTEAACHPKAHDTLTRNRRKNGTRKPVTISNASDMQFGAEFFWYQFLVKDRTCCIFVPVCGTIFLIQAFGADFWYVCHWHNLLNADGRRVRPTRYAPARL